MPRFVVRDFEEYLRCGQLEHGIVRLACRRCGHELLVGFACKATRLLSLVPGPPHV
ncbi:MAG: transposase zinc-binding domain-containing protein [Sandaracinaceae bacterium]|nr:transposase zinc-binding domain-containing protein [Sandaracinaceae bacterium]